MLNCEISDIGSLKEVNTAVCGLKSTDWTKESVKTIGISFYHNYQNKLNFRQFLNDEERYIGDYLSFPFDSCP